MALPYIYPDDMAANDNYITRYGQPENITGLSADLDRIRDYINDLQVELNTLQTAVLERLDGHDELLAQHQATLEQINADILSLLEDVDLVKQSITSVIDNIVVLTNNVNNNTNDIENLNIKAEQLQSDVTALYVALNDVNIKLDDVITTINSQHYNVIDFGRFATVDDLPPIAGYATNGDTCLVGSEYDDMYVLRAINFQWVEFQMVRSVGLFSDISQAPIPTSYNNIALIGTAGEQNLQVFAPKYDYNTTSYYYGTTPSYTTFAVIEDASDAPIFNAVEHCVAGVLSEYKVATFADLPELATAGDRAIVETGEQAGNYVYLNSTFNLVTANFQYQKYNFNGGVWTKDTYDNIPMASNTQNGYMPAESFGQLETNTLDIAALKHSMRGILRMILELMYQHKKS